MSKGSKRRPEDKKKFDKGWDKIFKDKRWCLETTNGDRYEFHARTKDAARWFFQMCGDRAYDYWEITDENETYPRCDTHDDV